MFQSWSPRQAPSTYVTLRRVLPAYIFSTYLRFHSVVVRSLTRCPPCIYVSGHFVSAFFLDSFTVNDWSTAECIGTKKCHQWCHDGGHFCPDIIILFFSSFGNTGNIRFLKRKWVLFFPNFSGYNTSSYCNGVKSNHPGPGKMIYV